MKNLCTCNYNNLCYDGQHIVQVLWSSSQSLAGGERAVRCIGGAMEPLRPIFWGQGMFLQPQHFQQQDCYHEARLRRYVHWLAPFAWGIKSLAIREAALQNFVCDIERRWTTRARDLKSGHGMRWHDDGTHAVY
jgi:hypothetical protein